jgi:hypothetical protein
MIPSAPANFIKEAVSVLDSEVIALLRELNEYLRERKLLRAVVLIRQTLKRLEDWDVTVHS